MKGVKKVSLTVICAVLLVACSVLGTMAYLTSTDEDINTFTVGKVKITLDEAKVNEAGEPIDQEGEVVDELGNAVRVHQNNYKLIPGVSYTKDPTVTVLAGSEKCYIRLFVTINNAEMTDELIDELKEDQNEPEITVISKIIDLNMVMAEEEAGADKPWILFGNTKNNDGSRTYEFRYYQTVRAIDNGTDAEGNAVDEDIKLLPLFTEISVPWKVTGTQLETLEGLKMDVIAQAIQAEGFENADEAWNAFD